MKLQAWLSQNGLSYAEFARRIGSDHARTVERYAKGQRVPRRAAMSAIRRVTGDQVTANDFAEVGE